MGRGSVIDDKNLDELTAALLGEDDATKLVQLFRGASEAEALKAVVQLADTWVEPADPGE